MEIFTDNKKAFRSIHPGFAVADELEALGLSLDEASHAFGVSLAELEQVCAGELDISENIALGLEKLGSGEKEIWLRMQHSHNTHPSHGGSRVGAGRKKENLLSKQVRISAAPEQMQQIQTWLESQPNASKALAELILQHSR